MPALPTTHYPLLTIVGPTASGKSELAMRLAKEFKGEIIAADSRTIYKGMDIGTAKPTSNDQKAVKHWGLDLVKPGQRYTAAAFKKYAEAAITDIQSRGKLPILVGGTGLYTDAVLYNFSFVVPKRAGLIYTWRSTAKLQKIIARRGWPVPENSQNRRHLLNTIRRRGRVGGRTKQPRPGTIIIGLLPPDGILQKRIAVRAEAIFGMGIIEETRRLAQTYGQKSLGGSGIAYPIIVRLLKGEINNSQAIELIKKAERQYARRQKTWFKRNRYIKWFAKPDEAIEYIKQHFCSPSLVQ